MINIEVYTDGSATTIDKPGGFGWVLVSNGRKENEGFGHLPNATNNDAELEAAIEGLKAGVRYAQSFSEPFEITLVSDSQLVLGWVSGRYTFRQVDKLDKYKEIQLITKIHKIKTRWVEGHTGDEHNERCDKLANHGRKYGGNELTVSATMPAIQTGSLWDTKVTLPGEESEQLILLREVAEKAKEALKSQIGKRDKGVLCVWWQNTLKIIDLERNIIEDHNELAHGKRSSKLQVQG